MCVCVCVRACLCVCACDDVFSLAYRLIMRRQLEQYTRREVVSCLQDEYTDSTTKTCVSSLLFFLFFFFIISFSFFRAKDEDIDCVFHLSFVSFSFSFAPKTRKPISHDLCFWMRKARDTLRGSGCSVRCGPVRCAALCRRPSSCGTLPALSLSFDIHLFL